MADENFEKAPGSSTYLISCSANGSMLKLSLEDGRPDGNPMKFPLQCEAYSAAQVSQNEIVIGMSVHTPFLYNIATEELVATLEGGHTERVYAVAFSSSLLVTAGQDRNIVVWNSNPGDADCPFVPKCQMGGHTGSVRLLDPRKQQAGSFDAGIIVSGSMDTTARVWDIEKEKCVGILRNRRGVFALCHDSERQVQFTGTTDFINCWDDRTNQKILSLKPPEIRFLNTMCFRQGKSQLVAGGRMGRIEVRDTRMLKFGATRPVNHWTAQGGEVSGCCDVEDHDFFVTTGFSDRHNIVAWRDDGTRVWVWKSKWSGRRVFPCLKMETRKRGADEFQGEEMWRFLLEFSQFVARISLDSSTIQTWRWVRGIRLL